MSNKMSKIKPIEKSLSEKITENKGESGSPSVSKTRPKLVALITSHSGNRKRKRYQLVLKDVEDKEDPEEDKENAQDPEREIVRPGNPYNALSTEETIRRMNFFHPHPFGQQPVSSCSLSRFPLRVLCRSRVPMKDITNTKAIPSYISLTNQFLSEFDVFSSDEAIEAGLNRYLLM